MAAKRIVDPNQFMLLGAVTDWAAINRWRSTRNLAVAPPKNILQERGLKSARLVQLRWLMTPALGYPTEPFKVWRRPAAPMQGERVVSWEVVNMFGMAIVNFDRPRVFVRVNLQGSSGGTILAFAGAPFVSSVVAFRTVSASGGIITLSGPAIQCLVVSAGVGIRSITGMDVAAADDPGWELAEIVGLPVDASWSGVLDLGVKQGLSGALTDPRDAALDRFRRGAPFYGWATDISASVAAPPWVLAEPKAMLQVMASHVLGPLRQMITTRAPPDQAAFTVQHVLPPASGNGESATTTFKPLPTLLFGAATDPLASLISGFGTALEDIDIPPIILSDRALFNDSTHSDWDFMVTARYAKGLDGRSAPAEFAAIVFAPGVAMPPPVPTGLVAHSDGLRAPQTMDADWHGVVRVSWDKLADTLLPFRVASFAFACAPQAPAHAAVALMQPRALDPNHALQPISATTSAQPESPDTLRALDDRYAIAGAPNPNTLLYALAHQDLFGLWSAWATTPLTIGEPPVRALSIIATRLEVTPVRPGPCPARLVVDFAWDWAARSPQRVEFSGRLYAQAKLDDPPANLSVPTGLQSSLAGGPGFILALNYNGSAAPVVVTGSATVTAVVQFLSLDGKSIEASPVTPAGPRRYRITVTGLSLDFDAAPRLGLALWARAIEHRAPHRVGAWSTRPAVTSSADPRPPVIMLEHEDVLMASMADAAGLHHAQLEWPAASGSVGYFVYTTTEEKLRADRGMASPLRSSTLAERLLALRDAFAANPSRRSFTRVNPQPVPGTRMQVTLPRGSKEIHLYVVLGVSAGQVESAWPQPGDPALRKRPIAYAAPQVVIPAPPDLEVSRVLDTSVVPPAYRAQLRVRAKSGATVTRIDLYRVRVSGAAVLLDTMGPPIARISGATADYAVTPTVSSEAGVSQPLGTITGRDAVGGSWKRVFYRAVAWAGNDPGRGLYGGRSQASVLRDVVVPPATPPDLSALTWHWPGGALGDARIDATSLAPVEDTPLGPHRIRVDVLAEHDDGTSAMLFTYPPTPGDGDHLNAVPTSPPAPGTHGLWRTPSGTPGQSGLHVLARRASTGDRLKIRLLLSDPLGRSTERALEVPAGSPLLAPDILMPKVVKIMGKGFVVSFQTSVPVTPTAAGPYVLSAKYVPRLLFPLPLPLPGPRRRPGGMAISVQKPLPDIRIAAPGENVFADSDAIPLRRAPGPGAHTRVAVAVRGSLGGKLTITLTAPDGRTKSLRRTLSRG